MVIYTIGFTQKSAEQFFGLLRAAGIRRLVDVRLNNTSQLAAFTKRNDLEFFLRELCGCDYLHQPLLAPTQDILDAYKKNNGDWSEYERSFTALMRSRRIEKTIPKSLFDRPAVLLCSEHSAEHCHRRLVAEYLREHWKDVDIVHL